jgi:hypothetical protein
VKILNDQELSLCLGAIPWQARRQQFRAWFSIGNAGEQEQAGSAHPLSAGKLSMIPRPSSTSDSLLLLVGHPPCIELISLLDNSAKLLVSNCGHTPSGITFDAKRRRVFWANMGQDQAQNDGLIEGVDLDGSNRVKLVSLRNTIITGQMVVDAEQGYLYWSDCEGMRIMRARFDGTEVTVLIQIVQTEANCVDEHRHCVGVAVDRMNNYLYWTQKGPSYNEGRVFRARLDPPAGENPTNRSDVETVLADLPEPVYLQWDGRNDFLYWTDRAKPPIGNTLNRAKYLDGRFVEPEILLGGLGEGIGPAIDIDNGRVFVGALEGVIRVMKLDRPGESEVIFSEDGPLVGIVYLPSLPATKGQSVQSPQADP